MEKKFVYLFTIGIFLLLTVFGNTAFTSGAGTKSIVFVSDVSAQEMNNSEILDSNAQNEKAPKMQLSVGKYTFTATFADNSSAQTLRNLLASGPLTIKMSDYNKFEKVGPLGVSLPTNDEQITAQLGDIILYQSNRLVIYYAPNSWSFTRLGKIDDVSELKKALGDGDITVTLSIK